MTDLVNPNASSLCSADFSFMMNPNFIINYRYTAIVSNMLKLPSKCIFSANQFLVAGHFYDEKTTQTW